MHLSERAYFLIVATAVLAIAGIWSQDPALALLWCWPAALLSAWALPCEGFFIRRLVIRADVETAARARLSVASSPPHSHLRNDSGRSVENRISRRLMPAGI